MRMNWAPALAGLASLSLFAASPIEQGQQRFQQGLAYERLGRLTDAYTELQLANTLDPASAPVAVALGIVASRLERYEAAQRALEQSITLDANSAVSYYQLALIYEHLDQKDRAVDAWHRFAGLTQEESFKQMAQKHIRHLEAQ
jgi:tetratricopeptide (TPR) repeat protein